MSAYVILTIWNTIIIKTGDLKKNRFKLGYIGSKYMNFSKKKRNG